MAAAAELGTTNTAARLCARAALPSLIVGLAMFAWWGTWNGAFIFDDGGAITDSRTLLEGDWWGTAFGSLHQPLANRPLTALSLVIDFTLFGPGPFGPRLVNLVLHFCNALLLFATLRRTLQAPNLAGRWSEAQARVAAAAVALLWCVHPLGVDAVAYATQRSTLLFSGFLLLALYASLRAHASPHPWKWRSLGVLAMSCGMASKEDMLLGPVLVVLFERAFLVPSWLALRGRLAWYGALALSWGVLAASVALGPDNPTVGSATGVTAWQWLMTQAGVVLHYVRLSLCPHPLRGAYDWGVVKNLGAAVMPGLAVLCLLGLTVICWRRRPWWGWLGSLFFLLLAPTSTVMPIVTEIAAERRAYLPMLAVIVPAVIVGASLVRAKRIAPWMALSVLAAAAVALAVSTRARVDIYATSWTFWQDTYAKREPGSRTQTAGLILTNYANELLQRDRVEEACALYDESIHFEGVGAEAVARFAGLLLLRNRQQEAVSMLAPLAKRSKNPMVGAMYGVCLVSLHEAQRGAADDPRLAEAEAALRRGTAAFMPPRSLLFWNSLAYVLRVQGRLDEALIAYEQVTKWNTVDLAPWTFRAELLQRLGRAAEIPAMLAPLLAARPRDAALRVTLAEHAIARGDRRSGAVLLREALQLEPSNTAALSMQRDLETQPR